MIHFSKLSRCLHTVRDILKGVQIKMGIETQLESRFDF